MRPAILLLIPLLPACGGGGEGNEAAGRISGEPVQTADLTGLYQGPGEGERRSRMCMISGSADGASFALATESLAGGSCGGAGEAVRQGNRLRLTMAGDEECAIEAVMDGTRVAFPASLAEGCAYYCGPGATLAGAVFEKTGGTAEDAMRAVDPAGDPLCG